MFKLETLYASFKRDGYMVVHNYRHKFKHSL